MGYLEDHIKENIKAEKKEISPEKLCFSSSKIPFIQSERRKEFSKVIPSPSESILFSESFFVGGDLFIFSEREKGGFSVLLPSGEEIGKIGGISFFDTDRPEDCELILPESFQKIPRTGYVIHEIIHQYIQEKYSKNARIVCPKGLTDLGRIFWERTLKKSKNIRSVVGRKYFSPDSEKLLSQKEYEMKYQDAVSSQREYVSPQSAFEEGGWGMAGMR